MLATLSASCDGDTNPVTEPAMLLDTLKEAKRSPSTIKYLKRALIVVEFGFYAICPSVALLPNATTISLMMKRNTIRRGASMAHLRSESHHNFHPFSTNVLLG